MLAFFDKLEIIGVSLELLIIHLFAITAVVGSNCNACKKNEKHHMK